MPALQHGETPAGQIDRAFQRALDDLEAVKRAPQLPPFPGHHLSDPFHLPPFQRRQQVFPVADHALRGQAGIVSALGRPKLSQRSTRFSIHVSSIVVISADGSPDIRFIPSRGGVSSLRTLLARRHHPA
ncbi:MAG: hypothetical protein ABF959_08825 [Gluconobacter albidus]